MSSSVQIGLLTPRSGIYPSINFDLAAGLRASLANTGLTDFEIKTAGIGVGARDEEIYAACEQLLFGGARFVVGYINPATTSTLNELFVNAGALLIHLDAGYNFFTDNKGTSNCFTLSLQGTLACRALISIAKERGHNTFSNVMSYYDGGYRAPFALALGMQEAGAKVMFNHVTALKKKDFSLSALIDHLSNNMEDAVTACFCGDMAVDLFTAMKADPVFHSRNIYASPFTVEETWLKQCPWPAATIAAIVPWAESLETPENKLFGEQLTAMNRSPNIFSLLAWEAGIMLAVALQCNDIESMKERLRSLSFASPRGKVQFGVSDRQQALAPMYLATIAEDPQTGNCLLHIDKEIEDIADQNQKLQADIAAFSGPTSSWLNVYACLD